MMNKYSINDVREIIIPKIVSPENMGSLSFIEQDIIPFLIKRVYYLYDVPINGERGGHAHKNLSQVLFALNGSFEIIIDDGTNKKTILLNSPNTGLFIPSGIWREMKKFTKNSICMVVASDIYKESDYYRNYNDFINSK